ncbi:MAG: hypothetical protein J5819_08270 [Eubacterium sp.]|nr:hypothetical protein [Eubacterium sp.]
MGTIITWLIVFAIMCGCLFAWSYMLHRGPHAEDGENGDSESCDGDCLHCAKNINKNNNKDKSFQGKQC